MTYQYFTCGHGTGIIVVSIDPVLNKDLEQNQAFILYFNPAMKPAKNPDFRVWCDQSAMGEIKRKGSYPTSVIKFLGNHPGWWK